MHLQMLVKYVSLAPGTDQKNDKPHNTNSTVDGSEIPKQPPFGRIRPCNLWDSNCQPQLVHTGFLNHSTVWSSTAKEW